MKNIFRPGTPGSPRSRASRTRTIVWGTLSVVALAAVVFGVAALSSPRGSQPVPTVARSTEPTSSPAYREALSALASGDTSRAIVLLRQVLKADPTNTAAKTKLDELTPPAAPSSETTKTKPKPADDSPFLKPVADLGTLLPNQVGGFSIGARLVQGGEAQVPLDPATAANAAVVSRVLLAVHDRGSKAAADSFVVKHLSATYSHSVANLDIHGTSASFGSDGTHLAAVEFARGRFAYEVILTSMGQDPGTLRSLAKTIAETFPTKP